MDKPINSVVAFPAVRHHHLLTGTNFYAGKCLMLLPESGMAGVECTTFKALVNYTTGPLN